MAQAMVFDLLLFFQRFRLKKRHTPHFFDVTLKVC